MGFWEIVFILVLALLLFGPKRLPEISRSLGRALGELRRATHELRYNLESEIDLDEGDWKAKKAPGSTPPEGPEHPPSPAGD